jgi:arginine-tRNA-protein transferase
MTESRPPKLLLTSAHPCPYLPDRMARNLVVEPGARLDVRAHTLLSGIGFRRSGDWLYRPHCDGCEACVPVRVVVDGFRPRRRHRRCWKLNSDLEAETGPVTMSGEDFALYRRYQSVRHPDGPMADSGRAECEAFMDGIWSDSRLVRFRAAGVLKAVAVVDWLEDGLSAVYSFFDPDDTQRGLGVFTVLWQIGEARRLGLEHVYLGYWIQQSPKMAYKTEFRPVQLFWNGAWRQTRPGRSPDETGGT